MTDRELTLDDFDAISKSSPEVTLESLPAATAPASAERPASPDGRGFLSTVAHQDFIPYAFARAAAADGMDLDLDFNLGDELQEKEWDELTAGLTDTAKENIASSAKSRAHAYFLTDLAKESQQADDYLASYGGWGIAGRIGANVFDPTNVLLAMGTGGVGVLTKAERLAHAAKIATTAAERAAVVDGAGAALKAGHAANVLKIGIPAAAENIGLQAIANEGDPNRDGWDLAYAGLGALAIGGVTGRVLSGAEKRTLQRLHSVEKAKLEALELRNAVDARRSAITGELGGDISGARAQLGDAAGRAAVFLGERDTDLTDYSAFRHALESNGKANAKNPESSALGIDQFTKGTWKGVVAKAKPKWAEGLSEAELLAARTDPKKSAEMVAVLDAENTAALRRANAPVNHFTLYATHHFGPSKGVRFAKASAETLMDDILSADQLKANAYLKGLTKAQAMAHWTESARKGGVDLGGMLDRIPANGTEARRAAQLAAFDKDTATTRLAELEDTLKAHQENVAKLTSDAEGTIPSGELRKLRREVDKLQSELNGHKGTPTAKLAEAVTRLEQEIAGLSEVRARRIKAMKAEDDLKLGPEVSASKHRVKLRESAADNITKIDRTNLSRKLGKAKDAHGRARFSLKERLQNIEPRALKGEAAEKARAALRALQGDDTPVRLTAEGNELRKALGLHDNMAKAHAADGATRGELQGLLKALKPKQKALDDLDSLDNLQSAADFRMESLSATGSAPSFGPDTLSAARAVGFDPGLHAALEGTAAGAPVAQMKLAGAVNLFGKGTFAGVLRGSDNEVVRRELGMLVGNSLGQADDSVVGVGASEVAAHLQKTMAGKFNAAVLKSYSAWMQENGIWRGRQWSRDVRGQYMRELGLHIRGQDSDSAAIKAAAGRVAGAFKDFLDEAKAAGVKGFENVEANANWLPRVFDFHAFHALNTKVGPDQLALLVQKGIQQLYPELADAPANKVATAYIKRMRELRVGNDAGLMQGMSFDDVGFLRQFLGESGLGSDEIEDVVSKFAAAKRPSKAAAKPLLDEKRKLTTKMRVLKERKRTRAALGKGSPKADKRLTEIEARLAEIKTELDTAATEPDAKSVTNQEGGFRHAKMRQKFDENFAMELRDVKANDGSTVRVAISDLFENNVEALFGRYSRTMSGHIGLAKVGIKSRGDFETRLRRVERELEADPDQLANVKKMAGAAYDIITARPLEDANLWSELMRTGRDIAYSTQMENAGLANIPDIASLLAYGNFKYTAKAFFGGDVFGAMWKRGTDGRLMDDLMQEIEETTGIGTDFLNNAIHSSYDVSEEYAEAMVGGKWLPRTLSSGFSKVGHGARVTSRAVTAGSGMGALNALSQRMAARNIIYRIKDDVLKGGRFSDARAAALGLDKAMKDRIAKQLKAHTEWTKGDMGGKIQRVNFNKWDDLDARDAFLYAVHREARKNIQEEDLGDTFLFQHKGIGKVLTQFRRFGITAWTKQTLRGIAEHDAETATRVALQFTLAAGVWQAKHQMVIAGMEAAGVDDEKIQKYRDANLTGGRIAAAGLRNSGFAALMPDIYDSTVGYAFGTPLFDVRNSGNSSGLFAGIPLVGLTRNIGAAASGTWQAIVRGDKQFDQRDARAWQALVPFGHHLLVAPVFQALTEHLPEGDEDPDNESVQWFK